MAHNLKLTAEDVDDNTTLPKIEIDGHEVLYTSVVGSLMYAMLGTRPDLAYTVGVLGRYSANPKRCHWEAAKRTLRYLKATADMILQFDGSDVGMDMSFHGYSDADWSGDAERYPVSFSSTIEERSGGVASASR
jgi:hypothetical protein